MAQALIRFGGRLLFTHGWSRLWGFTFSEWSCRLKVAYVFYLTFSRIFPSGFCDLEHASVTNRQERYTRMQRKDPPGFTMQIQDQWEGLGRSESQNFSLNIINFKWALMSIKNWFPLADQWAALGARQRPIPPISIHGREKARSTLHGQSDTKGNKRKKEKGTLTTKPGNPILFSFSFYEHRCSFLLRSVQAVFIIWVRNNGFSLYNLLM